MPLDVDDARDVVRSVIGSGVMARAARIIIPLPLGHLGVPKY